MKINLATYQFSEDIARFFDIYLDIKNDAITGREFFCPLGVKAAIKRRQVIICTHNHEVVAALRFYPRKRDGIVSIYQFAITGDYRRRGILLKMMEATRYDKFEVLCPIRSKFNEYYKKTNWNLEKKDKTYNYWQMNLELGF